MDLTENYFYKTTLKFWHGIVTTVYSPFSLNSFNSLILLISP